MGTNSWTTALATAKGWATPDGRAVSGSTAANWATWITAEMLKANGAAPAVLINLGVNDWNSALPDETTWKADMTTVLHAIHARMPSSEIYIMYPWDVGHDSDAATVHTWIDDLIAADPSYVNAGPDEAVWLKAGDNGATNTSDGKHYSAAGQTACSTAWQAVLP